MQSTISSLAEVIFLDSRNISGTGIFSLPYTFSTPTSQGRKLTIKDPYGTFGSTNMVISTMFNDRFENGRSYMFLSTNYASLQLYGVSNTWYALQSNTSENFSRSTFTINCNAPTYVLDVNSIANISTLNYAKIQASPSNMWVAVGQGGSSYSGATPADNIKYSYDGINWSNTVGGFDYNGGSGVAWNGKMWVAVGTDSNNSNATIKYSYNGINWSNSLSGPFTGGGQGVAWNGKMWVAVGYGDYTHKYSYDGINWSNGINGIDSIGFRVAWNGSMWVAVGRDDSNPFYGDIKFSYDGINWSNSSSVGFDGNGYGFDIAWNGKMWLAGGGGYDSSYPNIIYSYDGMSWSNTSNVGSYYTTCIGWNGYMWVAGFTDDYAGYVKLKYSYDGLNWFNSSLPLNTPGIGCLGVVWDGRKWIASGYDLGTGNALTYSYDGINWSNSIVSGQFVLGKAVAYSSNQIPTYQQTNLAILPQNIPITFFSTNTIRFTPSTMVINDIMMIDSMNRNIGINTVTPDPLFSLDVNGSMRRGAYFSTIATTDTYTIYPGSNFGVYYSINTTGSYTLTLSLPTSQALSNVGKFFVLGNAHATINRSITITGGTGITSPYTLLSKTSMTVTVNTTNSYTVF